MSETNVTIINMQPTTDYVNIGGPLINPSEYATKNEINEKLDNYATVKQATDIARNITDSALENGYYTSSEIDGKLDCKSNTDHTHTDLTLKTLNDMPIIGDTDLITTYPFIPTVGWYPFNVMQNLDFHNKVKSGYIWRLCAYTDTIFQIVNNGYVRLTIDKYGTYIDKNLRCDTINGINTSDISLNTHTHSYNDLNDIPETFPPAEHNHDDKYALVDHTHTTNDITDIDTLAKADHNHDEIYSKLEHTHTTSDITDIDTLAKADHNHDEIYSKLEHTHTTSDITDVSTLAKADHNHSYNDIQNNYFKIKTETKQELVDDIYYIVYDASELLNKEQNGAHISEWVKLKIKFLDNIEIIVDKNGLTIKVGKKEFIFSESGFFDGTEKA